MPVPCHKKPLKPKNKGEFEYFDWHRVSANCAKSAGMAQLSEPMAQRFAPQPPAGGANIGTRFTKGHSIHRKVK
jgi:hypothetical protein